MVQVKRALKSAGPVAFESTASWVATTGTAICTPRRAGPETVIVCSCQAARPKPFLTAAPVTQQEKY
jgi:hypothetical protein